MKQWRVGTLSMGVALILFGVILFSSQFSGRQAFGVLIDWWPIVFILLGLELLIYLGVSRMSQSIVKYDLFSIFFIALICMGGLGFAALTSTGLLQEVRYAVSSVERTVALPDVEEQLSSEIKQVVIMNNQHASILIDQTATNKLQVFGTYSYTQYEEDRSLELPEDWITVKTAGDTLYISLNQLPRRNGLRSDSPYLKTMIVLPDELPVEVTGNHKLL